MRTERNRVKLSNHLHAGEHANIPKDIHSLARKGFNAWQSEKPRSTELPNPWRKKKK